MVQMRDWRGARGLPWSAASTTAVKKEKTNNCSCVKENSLITKILCSLNCFKSEKCLQQILQNNLVSESWKCAYSAEECVIHGGIS